MDDEQGPWWTRPPEPGPQAPVVARPQYEPADEEPDDGAVTPPRPADPQPWVPQQFDGSPAPGPAADPEIDDPYGQRPAPYDEPTLRRPPDPEPSPFDAWESSAELPVAPPAPHEQQHQQPYPELRSRPAPANQNTEVWGPPPARPPAADATEAPPTQADAVPAVKPRKPRPVVRRVAVELPPEPPARPTAHDRTETLPALGDDIFAVFDAQGRTPATPAPPAGPHDPYAQDDDPLSHLRDEPQPHRLHVPHVTMPEPRFLLMAVGSGLVVLLVLLVVLLFDRGGDEDPTAGPTPSTRSNAVSAAVTGKTPAGLKRVSDAQATELLRKAGQSGGGQVVEAWSWNDENGRNLVVSTTEVTKKNRQTLKVIHVADLDGNPRTLRVMTDPDLPDCKNKDAVGAAGFTKNSMVVRDINGDGVAEVTAGWTSRCGSSSGPSEIKLALITNGKKYIIRESGVVGKAGTGRADPKSGSWPDGFYESLTKLYKKLYA